jgi:hypothetical protein
MDPQADEPTVQDIPERAGLVAAVHAIGQGQLTMNEADEPLFAEPLRRLRGLLIYLTHHNNETGMYIQPEFN